MWTEPDTLLIVATSGRAMAESAACAGYAVKVIDAFCDEDTRRVGPCVAVPATARGLDERHVQAAAEGLTGSRAGLIYGAGLERSTTTLSGLANRFDLFGNPPEVLEHVGDARPFFGLMDRLGIRYPETRFEPPCDDQSDWLIKETRSSGGIGVKRWRPGNPRPDSDHVFQRCLDGRPMSLLFIADGFRCSIIGVNRLRIVQASPDTPFLYGGATNRESLSAPTLECLEGWCTALVRELGLRGVNNLDFVLEGEAPCLLELNPRPSATLGLYDTGCSGGWMRRHVRACRGELSAWPADVDPAVSGHRIVYAPRPLGIPAGIDWPTWSHDRPPAGTEVERGQPLCSVSARGNGAAQTEGRLAERERRVLALVAGSCFEGRQR